MLNCVFKNYFFKIGHFKITIFKLHFFKSQTNRTIRLRLRCDLTKEGAVRLDPGVAPREHPEIDDGDETVPKYLNQIVDYEIGTVGTESFVVQRHRDVVGRTGISCRGSEGEQYICENKNGE